MPLSNVTDYINLLLGYRYLQPTKPIAPKRSHHIDSAAPVPLGNVTTPSDPAPLTNVVCGNCEHFANEHPIIESDLMLGDYIVCDRNPALGDFDASLTVDATLFDDGLRATTDYLADTYLSVTASDYSGPATRDYDDAWSALEPDPYATDCVIDGPLDRWYDQQPEEFTSAMHYRSPSTGGWVLYQPGSRQAVGNLPKWLASTSTLTNDFGISRNVYVEGTEGFHTTIAYDPALTAKYHLHLVNAFVEKGSGALRIGGTRITRSRDGLTVTAECVQSTCKSPPVTVSTTCERREQEEFTYAVLRHGNNHAARWYTDRATWYKLHTGWCDLNCSPKQAHCGPPSPAVPDPTELVTVTASGQ